MNLSRTLATLWHQSCLPDSLLVNDQIGWSTASSVHLSMNFAIVTGTSGGISRAIAMRPFMFSRPCGPRPPP